jgi:uncharacterized protein (DUF1810 family)
LCLRKTLMRSMRLMRLSFVVLWLWSGRSPETRFCFPYADVGINDRMDDPYNLQRFLDAQAAEFEDARRELREGQKRGHWMWFIFPQIKELGYSQTAVKYAISSRKEAEAYLRHPILGPRLKECTQLVVRVPEKSLEEIFGYPDNLKFRSSMTLFANVTKDNDLFQQALLRFCDGEPDRLTIERL